MDSSFEQSVLKRLPLAEAVLTLVRWVLDQTLLSTTYDSHRGRCYERLLTFANFVHLLFDCLSLPWTSARAGLLKAKEDGRLPVSLQAFYDKLKNTPVAVSLHFFRDAAQRLRALVPEYRPNCPASLRGLTTLLMDGKVVKHVCRRLKALRLDRHTACKLLGPRTLVVADRWSGLLHDLVADLDGEVNEVKYVAALLDRVLASVAGPWLIVGDRAFGCFQVCQDICRRGGHFLLRQHGNTVFVADPTRPTLHSTDRFGRPVTQEWGWITRGKARKDKPRPQVAVRRISVQREQSRLVLISDLVEPQQYPVDDLLDSYLARWDIEGIFQSLTEVFHLRELFSSSPQGMLVQLVLTFVMYNSVQAVKLYLAQQQGIEAERISTKMLFRDIQEELLAVTRLLSPEKVIAHIADYATATEVQQRLEALLKGRWCQRWLKANYRRRDPTRPAAPKTEKIRQRKAHDSVQRILERCNQ
jgi:hypothetical protein